MRPKRMIKLTKKEKVIGPEARQLAQNIEALFYINHNNTDITPEASTTTQQQYGQQH
jgi:hypothetical protein